MMKWQAAIPIAPVMRTGFRPSLSTYMTAGIYVGQHWYPKLMILASLVTYCSNKHGNTHYASREKGDGIAAHSELLEDGWGVIEHRIDTCPLLQDVSPRNTSTGRRKESDLESHSDCSDHDTTEHRFTFEQARKTGSLELYITPSICSLQMREVQLLSTFLKQTLRLDLQEFKLNQGIVTGKATEISEHSEGFVLTIMVRQPTRGEWHKYHSHPENDGWS